MGEGTSFIIYLPPLTESRQEMSAVETQDVVQGQGETVLLVEDDPILREALLDRMELLGYRVLEAADGLEALEALKQHEGEISLVLSDLVMPKMGGQALLSAMRDRGISLPVVMLSGYPMEKVLKSLLEQGLTGWMLKPPNIEKLSHLLAWALKEGSARRE